MSLNQQLITSSPNPVQFIAHAKMMTLYLDSTHPHSLSLYVTVQPGYSTKNTLLLFSKEEKKNPTGLEWCEDEQVIISRQTCFKIELAQTYHSSIRYCWCLECLNDKCQHFDGDPGSWVNKSAQNPTGDHHHSTQLELSKTHTWIKQRNGWDEKRQGWRVAKCHVFMPCTEQLILCLFPHKHMHFSRLNRVTRN